MMDINKIYCGDCLEYMKDMPDNSVDICITSPPYNIGDNRINRGFSKQNYNEYSDDLDTEVYFKITNSWINEILRICKYHVFWNVQESSKNRGIYREIENVFKDNIKERFVWAKTNTQSSIQDNCCGSGWEMIYCISKDKPEHRSFTYCNFSNRSGDYINNILIKPVGRCGDINHHFTFPEWLPEFFILNFSRPGDIILDPFMGSGTTAKMALKNERQFIGFEISQEYVDICNSRIKQWKEQDRITEWF